MKRDDRRGKLRIPSPRLALRWLCGAIIGLTFAGTACAEANVAPLGSIERVPWLVECAGPMPRLLAGSLVAIGALLLICILCCAKAGDKHGR